MEANTEEMTCNIQNQSVQNRLRFVAEIIDCEIEMELQV